jgi:DNA-binding NtrC family response regulator
MAPLAGRRFVVVDDDTAVREALSARLQAWGASVSAFDGLPGLRDWLREGHPAPDMLLTDHQIGAGSGLEVIEALRQQHGALPALLVTGNTAPAQIAQLARSGVPLLHKPFRAEALLAAIENALAGDRHRRAPLDEQARTLDEADRAGADAFSAR